MAVQRSGVQCVGEMLIRPMFFEEVNDKINGHSHSFPHITGIWTGGLHVIFKELVDPSDIRSLRIIDEGDYYAPDMKGVFSRPCLINIKAEIHHTLIALRKNTAAGCMYYHRDPDTELVIPEFNGWMKAAT